MEEAALTVGRSGNDRPQTLFLEFKASSLSDSSFPIKIGWVNEDGVGECHLIRPAGPWLENGCPGWSAASEAVHGISLQRLIDAGVPAAEVALRTAHALAAARTVLYSDAPERHAMWLEKLLAVAGLKNTVGVKSVQEAFAAASCPLLTSFSGLRDSVSEQMEPCLRTYARSIVVNAEKVEARRSRNRHRAMLDVESKWRVWSAINAEVASALEKRSSSNLNSWLFRATLRGKQQVIARADTTELESLLGSLTHRPTRDILTSWSLLALRSEDRSPEIHALGWRLAESNTWITSRIEILDRTAQLIQTNSGAVYRLGDPDADKVRPDLLRHLAYALRVWGYLDVAP